METNAAFVLNRHMHLSRKQPCGRSLQIFRSYRYLKYCILISAASPGFPALAKFEVLGEITYEILLPNGTSRGKITNQFGAIVDGCQWQITSIPTNRNASVISDVAGCDGTNIYRLTTIRTNKSNSAAEGTLQLGIIYPGVVPPSDISLISSV